MVDNPPDGFPQITPYLFYADAEAGLEWLVATFGFVERYRLRDANGRVNHAELAMGDGVLMLGAPGGDYRNPAELGGATQLVYVYVDDVDAHHGATLAAGPPIVRELEDQFYGDRTYGSRDPEGHLFTFAQHVRDVEFGEPTN